MQRLELYAGKLARTVLRGGWCSNVLSLPDIGRLGKDPEIRYTQSGDAVANVSLATTETWKDKQGQSQEKTEWHNLVFYRRQAEVVGEYLKKGSLIYVEGKITTEKYEKDGEDRYITKIAISEMKMLGGGSKVTDEPHQDATPVASRARNSKSSRSASNIGPEPF